MIDDREWMTSLAEATFWICAGVIVYVYAIYPAVIWLCSQCWGRRRPAPEIGAEELPTLTLLIAAHNEQQVIGARLENALAVDYPREKLRIVVASDGSTDQTAAIVRTFASRGVTLLDFAPNRGKAAALNAAWRHLTSEIVVLSDANTWIDPSAPRRLARWFRSPAVDVVCGRLLLVDPQTGRNADGLYWRYETFLKRCEARLGATLGANGAIYAVRRNAYLPIPRDTIIDDFVIPLRISLEKNSVLLYDDEAVASEETPPEIRDEFRRRVRIGAGGFQSLRLLWPLLDPRFGWLAFSFVSHKLLRWLCPFFLLGELAANLCLCRDSTYLALFIAQLAFLALSIGGASRSGQGLAVRLARLSAMFSAMNLALLLGFFRWLAGGQGGAWTPTTRAPR